MVDVVRKHMLVQVTRRHRRQEGLLELRRDAVNCKGTWAVVCTPLLVGELVLQMFLRLQVLCEAVLIDAVHLAEGADVP